MGWAWNLLLPGGCGKELQLHVPPEDGHTFRGSTHWKLESVRGRSVRQESLGRSSILKGNKFRLKKTTAMSGGGASWRGAGKGSFPQSLCWVLGRTGCPGVGVSGRSRHHILDTCTYTNFITTIYICTFAYLTCVHTHTTIHNSIVVVKRRASEVRTPAFHLGSKAYEAHALGK